MILIKLGGSVITDKSRETTARQDVIDRLAGEIASIPGNKIIVHGGGSFGHIKAKEHELHRGLIRDNQRQGVFMVQRDMRTLNRLVEDGFHRAGVPVASVPAGAITVFDNGGLASLHSEVFGHYLDIGITPITFGDVVVDRTRGISICSGDDIMLELARSFGAELCVFVTNVDGIFAGFPPSPGEVPLEVVKPDQEIDFRAKYPDVTGSMGRKLELMFGMASPRCKVVLVNGLVPGRLGKVLRNENYVGTEIRSG